MILERKQRGNRTYLIFFTKKEKNQNSDTQSITIRSRNHPKQHFYPGNFCCFMKNDVFWQETFVASFNKKRNYLLRSDFVNFWSCFASWYSQTNAFQAPSSLNTPCGISSGSSPLLLASASLNQALLS